MTLDEAVTTILAGWSLDERVQAIRARFTAARRPLLAHEARISRELRNALALLGTANADAAVEALGDASDDILGCASHRGYPELACNECMEATQ